MATAIAAIPELEGPEAEAFVRQAEENFEKRGTIPLEMSWEEVDAFLEKSKRFLANWKKSQIATT